VANRDWLKKSICVCDETEVVALFTDAIRLIATTAASGIILPRSEKKQLHRSRTVSLGKSCWCNNQDEKRVGENYLARQPG